MNRKVIKKIMLFLLAFMLVFPVYSFGKAEAVQAAALKALVLCQDLVQVKMRFSPS